MQNNTFNFPSHVWNDFFQQSIGFERLLNKIQTSHTYRKDNSSYPPFNIIKTDSSSYEISVAVAGFKADDIKIMQQDNLLTIVGEVKQTDDKEYLVKNIASRYFQKGFSLNEYAVIDKVTLKNGILSVSIKIKVSEEQKPKTFNIEVS